MERKNTNAKAFSVRFNEALNLRQFPTLGNGRTSYIQEVFDVSRAGATKWLHGKSIPHRNKRKEIASKLGISLNWLEMGTGSIFDDSEVLFSAKSQVVEIPLFDLCELKHLSYFKNKKIHKTIVINKNLENADFATINVGNAMIPRFSDGDILIVEVTTDISDGDYVVVKTKSFPEALFRQYRKGASKTYLSVSNPKFDSIELSKDDFLIGKVIETRSSIG
jgi:phage repressor protein C with HTH and peptisase S24 domain